MNREFIEQTAWDLQADIWRQRNSLWASFDIPIAHKMLTVDIATKVLGIKYEEHSGLGAFGDGAHRFEVAGFVDRQKRKIAVSQRFDVITQRFTGAHEVGHWLLHKNKRVLHRDRQITGPVSDRIPRPLEEREADYFSACYLVPRNMARAYFEDRFGPIEKFRFNEDAAFGLRSGNMYSLLNAAGDSLEWEIALSSTIQYQGSYFESLADTFQVSPKTMAIRLKEIGLRR